MRTILLLFAVLLINITHAQNFEWAKQFGGAGNDAANSVTTDASGNVYVTGAFSGTVDFDPGVGVVNLTSAGGFDIFITKQNAAGNLVWVKQIGAESADRANSIFIDQAGNIYLTGSFSRNVDFDPGPGTHFEQASPITYIVSPGMPPPPPAPGTFGDIFILKLDPSGNFVWVKRIGGSAYDFGKDIKVDAAGNVYTIGFFSDFRVWVPFNIGEVDFDPGPGVYNLSPGGGFILKLDPSGNFLWAKQMGQPAGGFIISFQLSGYGPVQVVLAKYYSITFNSFGLDQEGNIYTTGSFELNKNDFDPGPGTFLMDAWNGVDVFIVKLNSSGNFVWAKRNSGTGPFTDEGAAIASDIVVDPSGNIYTTGYFAGKVDFDPGPGETIFETQVTGGNSEWMKPHHDVDIFVSKLNSSGDLVWAKQMGGPIDDRSSSITLGKNGHIYTTGYFSGNADFDPGKDKFKLNEVGGGTNFMTDAFISELDGNGNFVWAGQLGGLDNDRGIAITTDLSGNIYTTGVFRDECDFDPATSDFNLTSVGFDDIFIHKLGQAGTVTGRSRNDITGLKENINNKTRLYPNPANSVVTIQADKIMDKALIRVFNASGQLVMEKSSVSGTSYSMNIAGLSKGFYSVEINNNGAVSRLKLIKN